MEEKTYVCARSGRLITAREGALMANCVTGDWALVSLTEEAWSDYGIPWTALADPGTRKELLAHFGRKPWFRPEKLYEVLAQLEG